MASTPEWDAARRTLAELRRNVTELRARYGDVPAVRRLAGDVERFEIDLDELGELPEPATRSTSAPDEGVVEVPSESYDESLWQGGDDEGVGGYHADR